MNVSEKRIFQSSSICVKYLLEIYKKLKFYVQNIMH